MAGKVDPEIGAGVGAKPARKARCQTRDLHDIAAVHHDLKRLGKLQCTRAEVAQFFGTEQIRVDDFLANCEAARKAFSTGLGEGLVALRHAQFKLAATNATMSMFLGKNYLGQFDRREAEQSGDIDLSDASRRVRDKLAALALGARTREGHQNQ